MCQSKNLLARVTRINNQFKQGANERMAWQENQQQLHKRTHSVVLTDVMSKRHDKIQITQSSMRRFVPNAVCLHCFIECPPPSKADARIVPFYDGFFIKIVAYLLNVWCAIFYRHYSVPVALFQWNAMNLNSTAFYHWSEHGLWFANHSNTITFAETFQI